MTGLSLETQQAVALVGASCYAPGGCETPEQLWALLMSGHDCVRKFPRSRFDVDAVDDIYLDQGHFCRNIELFDNAFFGIGHGEVMRCNAMIGVKHGLTWHDMTMLYLDSLHSLEFGMGRL